MRILKTEREVIDFVNSLSPEVAVEIYEALRDHPNLRTTQGILLIYDALMKDVLVPYDGNPPTKRQDRCRKLLVYRALKKKKKKTGKMSRLTREEVLQL